MEEIDIIELLQRVKEGKEPNRIKICDNEYYRNASTRTTLNNLYRNCSNDYCWFFDERINFNTKIKILELDDNELRRENIVLKKKIQDRINELNEIINSNDIKHNHRHTLIEASIVKDELEEILKEKGKVNNEI